MIKKSEKRSFVFYDSFLSAMKHLNEAEFRECVLKIRDYALEGVDEESLSPYVNIILAMAKPNIDSARRRYMASEEEKESYINSKSESNNTPPVSPCSEKEAEDVAENYTLLPPILT